MRSFAGCAVSLAFGLLVVGCGGSGGDSTGTSAPSTPTATRILAKAGGDDQTVGAGTAVPIAPSVKVTDQNGLAVYPVTVTFAVASGGGNITGATQATGVTGVATVASWTLGPTPGSNTLTATATGVTGSPVTFTATGTAPTVSINVGPAQQLFHAGQPDALGLLDVPDMKLGIVQQADKSYRVFISGIIGVGGDGSTGMITTTDFLTYRVGFGTATKAQPVIGPSCPGHPGAPSCWNNFDADYAGANTVFNASTGTDLLMIYHAETRNFGSGPPNQHSPAFAQVGLARSTDNGVTWVRQGAIVSGADPKPSTNPTKAGVYGVSEPYAIIAAGFIYMFYPYTPLPGATDDGPTTLQVARAQVSVDAAPGTWTKYYNGAFGSQPGLGGLGSQIVPTVSACTRPVQPSVAFNTYLNKYVLLFVCNEGWFFSLSADLVNWSAPTNFNAMTLFTKCTQNDDNLVFVTPGNASQVIGRTGYVLYASTPQFGFDTAPACAGAPHELWMRPFTFAP